MKKILIVLLLTPFIVEAQRQTEYNRKGDEAMKQMDYQIARMWYEEGVLSCDRYSINQLTSIWMADESMHVSMGPVMAKCLNCLTEAATERKDSLAMQRLIVYYTEGIGATPSESSATYWKEQLEQLRNPFYLTIGGMPKDRMKFFVGYHASSIAPFGLQVGAMNDTWGFYVRIRTDMSFLNSQETCKNGGENRTGIIQRFEDDGIYYDFLNKDGTPAERGGKVAGKASTLIGTGGIMFRAFPDVYLSVGAGYARYDVFYRYGIVEPLHSEEYTSIGWAKNTDVSLNGVALDLDATVRFAGRFYGTVGCTLLHFERITPSIGIGFIFN